jgi:hypothetical protein
MKSPASGKAEEQALAASAVTVSKVSQAAVRVKVFTPQHPKPSPSTLFVNGLLPPSTRIIH